jgi:hypothetical protein
MCKYPEYSTLSADTPQRVITCGVLYTKIKKKNANPGSKHKEPVYVLFALSQLMM